MKHKDSAMTAVTLAAAGSFISAIAEKVLGKDVADTVAGTPLSSEVTLGMAQSAIEKNLVEQSVEA